MSCYLKERDLYGWKCQDARAMVSELNVLVAHFDDHFEKSFFRYIIIFFLFIVHCVCAREGARTGGGREGERENETKIRKFKNKKKFDLQKVKNREREKKIASCRQTVQYQCSSM